MDTRNEANNSVNLHPHWEANQRLLEITTNDVQGKLENTRDY